MTYNDRSKEYWNHSAYNNPEGKILHGWTEGKFWNTKVKIEGLSKDMIFLDLGCGIGRIAKWIAPLVKEYYGVDFADKMIERAKDIYQNYENIHFVVNNGIDLSLFEDNKFDFVYVCLLFQHMGKETTLKYIDEVWRVLKDRGIFLANNIPKIEKYNCGLTREEVAEAMKGFLILDMKIDNHYMYIKAMKDVSLTN
jgi:ubiquinone/menaquinone biosynthesis C-methylase UbiE